MIKKTKVMEPLNGKKSCNSKEKLVTKPSLLLQDSTVLQYSRSDPGLIPKCGDLGFFLQP